jgi:predicted NUDIX family NTP pyrophosphohydrolase
MTLNASHGNTVFSAIVAIVGAGLLAWRLFSFVRRTLPVPLPARARRAPHAAGTPPTHTSTTAFVARAPGPDGGRQNDRVKRSAGILPYRHTDETVEVWLAHPGGPFWAKKDERAWGVVKGEHEADEEALAAARREFGEETGIPAPEGDYADLGEFRQSAAKTITVFAVEHDLGDLAVRSNTVEIEIPRGSGRFLEFPEIDDARWFDLLSAADKIHAGQLPVLAALVEHLTTRA